MIKASEVVGDSSTYKPKPNEDLGEYFSRVLQSEEREAESRKRSMKRLDDLLASFEKKRPLPPH